MESSVIIRKAIPSDGRKLNAYIRRAFEDGRHLITRPDEFRMGPIKQRFWIARKAARPLETCLLAEANGEIIGMLESWADARARVRRTTSFGMSVDAAWRGQGIGKALLVNFIDWVKQHETLERIELHVHADNAVAIGLYRSLGFVLEGTRKKAITYEDGRIVDDHIMALWPGQHFPEETST